MAFETRLAVLSRSLTDASIPPSGPDWLQSIKHDGYRLIARQEGGRTRLFSRRGHETGRLLPLAPLCIIIEFIPDAPGSLRPAQEPLRSAATLSAGICSNRDSIAPTRVPESRHPSADAKSHHVC